MPAADSVHDLQTSRAIGVKFLDGVGFTRAHQLCSPHGSFGVCVESLPVSTVKRLTSEYGSAACCGPLNLQSGRA
jgi:hypothetical protein